MAAPNHLVVYIILFANLLSSFSCQNEFAPPMPSIVPPRDVEEEVTRIVKTNMIAIQAKSEKFLREVITRRLLDPDTPTYSQMCMNQCEENYVNANLDILRVLDDISRKNYDKAGEDVDAIVTENETCSECLNDIVGEDGELKAHDGWVGRVADDCHAQLQRLMA